MNKIPVISVTRYDEDVQKQYDDLKTRSADLRKQVNAAQNEINKIGADLGAIVANSGDYKELINRRAALRLEVEALEAGILHLHGLSERLRQTNNWIRR